MQKMSNVARIRLEKNPKYRRGRAFICIIIIVGFIILCL